MAIKNAIKIKKNLNKLIKRFKKNKTKENNKLIQFIYIIIFKKVFSRFKAKKVIIIWVFKVILSLFASYFMK